MEQTYSEVRKSSMLRIEAPPPRHPKVILTQGRRNLTVEIRKKVPLEFSHGSYLQRMKQAGSAVTTRTQKRLSLGSRTLIFCETCLL